MSNNYVTLYNRNSIYKNLHYFILFLDFYLVSGEVDYEELFYSRGSGKDNTWGSGNEMALFHPITAHLLYITFVIIVSFVLMNLLIGLAVNDIQVKAHSSQCIERYAYIIT